MAKSNGVRGQKIARGAEGDYQVVRFLGVEPVKPPAVDGDAGAQSRHAGQFSCVRQPSDQEIDGDTIWQLVHEVAGLRPENQDSLWRQACTKNAAEQGCSGSGRALLGEVGPLKHLATDEPAAGCSIYLIGGQRCPFAGHHRTDEYVQWA
jgi:hypothetical protein